MLKSWQINYMWRCTSRGQHSLSESCSCGRLVGGHICTFYEPNLAKAPASSALTGCCKRFVGLFVVLVYRLQFVGALRFRTENVACNNL